MYAQRQSFASCFFEARVGHEGDAWSTKLQVSALPFAKLYEQFVGSVSNFFRTYSVRDVSLVQQPRTAGRQAARQRLQRILTTDSSPFAPMDVKVRPHTVFSFGRVSHGGLLETLFLVSGVCSFSIYFLTRTLQRWIRP